MTNQNENQQDNIDHDGAFKELLHQLFEWFLRLFFPAQAEQLDFAAVTFLEQERLTDFPSGRLSSFVLQFLISGTNKTASLIHWRR